MRNKTIILAVGVVIALAAMVFVFNPFASGTIGPRNDAVQQQKPQEASASDQKQEDPVMSKSDFKSLKSRSDKEREIAFNDTRPVTTKRETNNQQEIKIAPNVPAQEVESVTQQASPQQQPSTIDYSTLEKMISEGKYEAARNSIREMYFSNETTSEQRDRLEALMLTLSKKLYMESLDSKEFDYYIVRQGDSLAGIALKLRKDKPFLEYGAIKILNGIKNDLIRPGQKLRIPQEPLEFVVRKSSFTLMIFYRGLAIKSYSIAIGANGRTPSGKFTVGEKTAKPTWYPPEDMDIKGPIPFGDKRNILGTHWIALDHEFYRGFGIHGTWEPESIGKAASRGCIRMRNEEVKEVFEVAHQGMSLIILE